MTGQITSARQAKHRFVPILLASIVSPPSGEPIFDSFSNESAAVLHTAALLIRGMSQLSGGFCCRLLTMTLKNASASQYSGDISLPYMMQIIT